MNKSGTPFLSFLSYTQRFVCSHDCTLHGIGFWKIYVILTAQSSIFATNVRKTPRKCRSWAACHPGASEKMHVQFLRHQFAPGWEFHPGQDRRGTFIPRWIFFQFFSCKLCKAFDHTQGSSSTRGEILVVNRP